jgi:CheY-like chemotaxis protein
MLVRPCAVIILDAVGMDGYVTRPIRREDLLRAIQETLADMTP